MLSTTLKHVSLLLKQRIKLAYLNHLSYKLVIATLLVLVLRFLTYSADFHLLFLLFQ